VILRAEFSNPQQLLLPGMFVTAHLQDGFIANGILAPQVGITHNQRGEPTAMVITDDNKVELRVIKTDRAIGDKWLVREGLKAGDRLIVDGVQKARPGATVHGAEMPADPATTTGVEAKP
jgi:membrane fusion protein (multidrug efflux system)